jgi:probable rRNA maturation factor
MGHDWPTDVLSFALKTPGRELVGDIYISPWVARREARARGISPREELIRLLVHGTLHVLGRDHPEGSARTRSAMWRRQERYVEALA